MNESTPITMDIAECRTGLDAREMTGTSNHYLACQLGKFYREERPCPRTGAPMNVRIFRLVAWGETWAAAAHRATEPATLLASR